MTSGTQDKQDEGVCYLHDQAAGQRNNATPDPHLTALVRGFGDMGRYEAEGRRIWVGLEDGDTAGCGGELVGALDEAEPDEHRDPARDLTADPPRRL